MIDVRILGDPLIWIVSAQTVSFDRILADHVRLPNWVRKLNASDIDAGSPYTFQAFLRSSNLRLAKSTRERRHHNFKDNIVASNEHQQNRAPKGLV